VCITVGVRVSKEAWFGHAHATRGVGWGGQMDAGSDHGSAAKEYAIRSVAMESLGCFVFAFFTHSLPCVSNHQLKCLCTSNNHTTLKIFQKANRLTGLPLMPYI